MSTSKVNIKELSKRTDELEKLIHESDYSLENLHALMDSYMHDMTHVFDDPYEYSLPDDASLREKVMYGIKREVSPVSRVIIGVGESAYLTAKTTWKVHAMFNPSRKKQKELLACYKELTVKHHLLIQAQQELIMELEQLQTNTDSEVQSLKKQLQTINGLIKRIAIFKGNVESSE